MKAFKHLISVSAVAFLIYIFTFYIDGEMGIILLSFLVFAPLLSLVLAVYGRNRIKVSFDCDGYVKKGSKLAVTVTVEKDGGLPFAFVDIKPEFSAVFGKSTKTYRLSMLNEHRKDFTFTAEAVTGGNGEISIDSVYSCGFLGFIRLKSKLPLPQPKNVGVIPEIPEIKASSQLFRSIADVVMTSDDEEENDTAMMFSANTTAGYEHREYVMGDPLKRINWKLSTKKSKLMVRLDEAVSSVQPSVLLDLFRSSSDTPENAVIGEEKLLVSVFGLLALMAKQGIACAFTYYSPTGEIITESVDNPEYPAQLLLKILSVKVIPDRRIDIQPENSTACACVVCTTDTGKGFTAITDKIENHENTSIIGISQDSPSVSGIPLWYLGEDNNFIMV
ncbi:MAG: DUF58 domain-containing protein [Ruminococcus flavefaciens]|nr:DUF58 domain-containing protein [Ruminococcus flavefaciens]